MRAIRHLTNIATILVAVSLSSTPASEPRPKIRNPDDRMLQQIGPEIREIRSPLGLDEPAIYADSNAPLSELPLSGPRTKETPSASKHGRYCENGFLRSGLPFCLGRFAMPSTDRFHQVGYVGGGTLYCGSPRGTDEGTFGMDYAGHWFWRKSWLKWSHGDRYQGGAGRYETEGPRMLPER